VQITEMNKFENGLNHVDSIQFQLQIGIVKRVMKTLVIIKVKS